MPLLVGRVASSGAVAMFSRRSGTPWVDAPSPAAFELLAMSSSQVLSADTTGGLEGDAQTFGMIVHSYLPVWLLELTSSMGSGSAR